jgi:hypothetical protein
MGMWNSFFAARQIDPSEIGIDDPVTNANGLVTGVLDTVYLAAGIVCVIIIIVAGYLYTTSNATPQRIKRAKDAIIYALVGLIVVAMAFVITQFVIGRI